MNAEELVAHLVAKHPHTLPCGHVDTGEAGCGGCADERAAEAKRQAPAIRYDQTPSRRGLLPSAREQFRRIRNVWG